MPEALASDLQGNPKDVVGRVRRVQRKATAANMWNMCDSCKANMCDCCKATPAVLFPLGRSLLLPLPVHTRSPLEGPAARTHPQYGGVAEPRVGQHQVAAR